MKKENLILFKSLEAQLINIQKMLSHHILLYYIGLGRPLSPQINSGKIQENLDHCLTFMKKKKTCRSTEVHFCLPQ